MKLIIVEMIQVEYSSMERGVVFVSIPKWSTTFEVGPRLESH